MIFSSLKTRKKKRERTADILTKKRKTMTFTNVLTLLYELGFCWFYFMGKINRGYLKNVECFFK